MKKLLAVILICCILPLGACEGITLTTNSNTGTTTTPDNVPPEKTTQETTVPANPTSPASEEEPPQPSETGKVTVSDNNVTIVIDRIERADVVPDDIVEALSSTRPYQAPLPADGCDFFFIHFTITRIEGIHITSAYGYGEEEPSLYNAAGQKYKRIAAHIKGIVFHDPHDITSDYEIAEGATVFWFFEVPKVEYPSRFELIYSYKLTFEEETEQRGQINIIFE